MKSHCLVLGFVAIVAYVSAQDFHRAKRLSLAVVDPNKLTDEFHQKIEEAKKSSATQLDTNEASKVSQFLDCIGQTDKGLVACNEEVLGGLTEEDRDNFYEKLSEIAPAAVDDPNADDEEDDEDEE